jgi:HSP20 family protein
MIKKNENATTTQPARRRSWDPWQAMRDAFRDPFGAMTPYTQEQIWTPSFEVRETNDAFVFKADLPGVKENDIDIELNGNRLTLSGKREQEHEEKEGETVFVYERTYGSFYRAFTLPDNVDTEHVAVDFKDGVLKLVVPKKAGPQPKKIQVGKGAKQ